MRRNRPHSSDTILQAVRSLLDISQDFQRSQGGADRRATLPFPTYVREYCTVRLAGPRRSGHSTAAVRLADDEFDGNAILIAPTEVQARQLSGHHDTRAFSLESLIAKEFVRVRGMSLDAVIVDSYSQLSQDQAEALYSDVLLACFSHAPECYFVLLG